MVVYEDQEMLVVDKPAGLAMHPGRGHSGDTLVEEADGLPVHRLDHDTSGLVVLAKTPEACAALCRQAEEHSLKRRYTAVVWGNLPDDFGTIEANIGRVSKRRSAMGVFPAGSGVGKEALTAYKVLERYGALTLVECELLTGRHHQIRAHMRHIGHPLFGDRIYGGRKIWAEEPSEAFRAWVDNCLALCPRQALHAGSLTLSHPSTGQEMTFTSPLPEDFQALLAECQCWRSHSRTGSS